MVHRSSVTDNPAVRFIVIIIVCLILILLGLAVLGALFWKKKRNERRSNTGECFLVFHIL